MNSVYVRFQIYVWIATIIVLAVKTASQDKSDCANQLIDWCEKVEFQKNNYGVSTISFTDSEDGSYPQITCTKDYGGVTCTKNYDPLFFCSRSKKLFYKDNLLQKNSSEDLDDDICYAVTISDKMHQQYQKSMKNLNKDMQNLRSNLSSQFHRQQEHLNEQMTRLNDRLDAMKRKFSRPCFPFCN